MFMLTSCMHCNEMFDVEDSNFGQEIPCLKCHKLFRAMMYAGDRKPSPTQKQDNRKKLKFVLLAK